MKKRGKLFLLLAGCILTLVGWGQKKVELLSDKKLIDLSAAIGKCALGADEISQQEGTSTQNPSGQGTAKPTVKPTLKPTVKPTVTPKPSPTPSPRTIVISVRDCKITYDSQAWEDIDTLKERISKDHGSIISFQLVDDYAETHVFRRIMAILEELEAEIGIRYIRE